MGFSSPVSQCCELELLGNTSKKLLPEARVSLSKSSLALCDSEVSLQPVTSQMKLQEQDPLPVTTTLC